MESLNSRSVLPPGPPYGSNWGHKIADFEFLPYISFIVAFIASECIKSSVLNKPFLVGPGMQWFQRAGTRVSAPMGDNR